jgi:hypothetical protein
VCGEHQAQRAGAAALGGLPLRARALPMLDHVGRASFDLERAFDIGAPRLYSGDSR